VTLHALSIYTHTHTHTKTGLDSVVLKACKKMFTLLVFGVNLPHIEMNGKCEKKKKKNPA